MFRELWITKISYRLRKRKLPMILSMLQDGALISNAFPAAENCRICFLLNIWDKTPGYQRDIFLPPILFKMRFFFKISHLYAFSITLANFFQKRKTLNFSHKKASFREITILSALCIKVTNLVMKISKFSHSLYLTNHELANKLSRNARVEWKIFLPYLKRNEKKWTYWIIVAQFVAN